MGKLNFSWLEKAVKGTIAFGRKNAPALMTGGSIALGWTAAYLFWKESRNADAKIKSEEEKQGEELSVKEKFIIYLQYCWLSLVLGLGSTGLTIGAHKLELERIAEMYMLTQFLEDKNEKQGKMLDKLKEEVGEKKVQEIEDDILDEDYSRDEIIDSYINGGVEGGTLFIDNVTHNKWRGDILDVTSGIAETNQVLKDKRKRMIKRKLADPFYSNSDSPFGSGDIDDDRFDQDIYSSVDLSVFLKNIGEISGSHDEEVRLSELLEFRYYGGGGDLLKGKEILKYKQFEDPSTGFPAVCYVDYTEFLSPSSELMERNPL